MTNTDNQLSDSILRWPELAKRVPISRSHAHALAAQGKFPKPIKIGPRASGWLESEINAWLAERIFQSRSDNSDAVQECCMNTHSRGREGCRSESDSTISPKDMSTYRVEHNFVAKNVANTSSLRLAINAMCFHCMGCTESHYEPGVKEEIRDCSSQKCPLWYFRPYKARAKETGGL